MTKMKLFLYGIDDCTHSFYPATSWHREENENPSKFSVGADFYSSYIWRGLKLGTGPAFQPNIEFATGG